MYPIIQLVIEGSCKQQFCTEELEAEWQILLFHKNYFCSYINHFSCTMELGLNDGRLHILDSCYIKHVFPCILPVLMTCTVKNRVQ